MRFFRCSPDEILITDGKTNVLVMARGGGGMSDPVDVEIESTYATYVCIGCGMAGTIFWEHCEECPKEVEPR